MIVISYRIKAALINIYLTVFAFVAFHAVTLDIIDQVMTSPIVSALLVFNETVIYVVFTVCPSKAFRAVTSIFVETIPTFSSILTWVPITIIDVVLATVSLKSLDTLTRIAVVPVHTCAAMLTGICYTIINVYVAIFS